MYQFHASSRRIDWIFQQFGGPAATDVHEFVRLVNEVYYTHFASVYGERHVEDIESQYDQLFRELHVANRDDWHIVDVGGGIGFEYDQFVRNRVQWNKYYFVEPDRSMADQFRARHDPQADRVEVIQGRLEDFATQLHGLPNKLVVFNSCLHHVIWVESVLDIIKSSLGPGDLLLLCHEPNNAYVGSPLMVLNYLMRCFTTDLIPRKLGLRKSPAEASRQACWSTINDEMCERGITSRPMPALVIRRTIDYGVGVKGDWKAVRVPREFDEGHWTPRELAQYMGTQFRTRFLRTYRCLGDPARGGLLQRANTFLDRCFPRSGSVFCMALERVE